MEKLKLIQTDINEMISILQNKGSFEDIWNYLEGNGWDRKVNNEYEEIIYSKYDIKLEVINDLEIVIEYGIGKSFVIERNFNKDYSSTVLSLRFE